MDTGRKAGKVLQEAVDLAPNDMLDELMQPARLIEQASFSPNDGSKTTSRVKGRRRRSEKN